MCCIPATLWMCCFRHPASLFRLHPSDVFSSRTIMVRLVWRGHKGGGGALNKRIVRLHRQLCYISRQGRKEEGGREMKEGWGYCEWKTKCFSNTRADTLWWTQQGASILLSAGQGSFNGSITSCFFYSRALIFLSEGSYSWKTLSGLIFPLWLQSSFKSLINNLCIEVVKTKDKNVFLCFK